MQNFPNNIALTSFHITADFKHLRRYCQCVGAFFNARRDVELKKSGSAPAHFRPASIREPPSISFAALRREPKASLAVSMSRTSS